MARPSKTTVDYFPHDTDASHRKTLTVLQSRFGNDGYTFWFKLLELLGRSPGHYYSYKNPEDLEFLSAETQQQDTESVLNILAMLDTLGAVDHDLYEQKVIWCQRFVDGVAEAYRRAKHGVPQRPDNGVYVSKSGESVGKLPAVSPESGTETPYIRLDKIKQKQTKEDTPLLSPQVCPSLESIINAYQDNILLGGTATEEMEHELKSACRRYTEQWVLDAMKEALEQNQPTWRYIMGILKNWSREVKL